MSKLVSGGCGLWSGAALLAAAILSGCGSSRGEPLLGAAGGFTASAGTGTGGNGGLPAGGTGGGLFTGPQADAGAGAECERSVSLTAVTLSEPQPFDLIIVADNSDSLAWSRSELSSGLHDLLTRVQGRSVRVFLLTPTQYGATSANAKMPLSGDSVVAWQDPETGSAYQNAVTQFEQVCTDPAGATITCPNALGPTPYSVQGTWRFVMPPPIATIRPDMTDAEFGVQRDAVASAILALEGHGSPHEQPLCTLSRYISQDPSVLPTNAVFLLIEDEDDISVPRECLSGFSAQLSTVKAEAGSTPCTSNCDAYRYSAIGSSRTKGFNFACAAFDDLGKAIPGTDQSGYASQGNQPTCDGIVAGACTAEESQTVGTFCEPGRTLLSCERECGAFDALSCSVELHDGAIDPCTQAFTLGGKNYANLADYCAGRGSGWHACTGGGLNIQYTSSLGGGYSLSALFEGTQPIGAQFRVYALDPGRSVKDGQDICRHPLCGVCSHPRIGGVARGGKESQYA